MLLGEALLSALKDAGARHLYGIPGDGILPFFEQAESTRILPLVTLSHEPGIGYAADAAARLSGRPGAVAVAHGAGALNLINAVAGAYAECSPLFVVAGYPSVSGREQGALHQFQEHSRDLQSRLFAEITCDRARLTSIEQAPECIGRLIQSCLGHSRPVLLELPGDLTSIPCEPVTLKGPMPYDNDTVKTCAEAILKRLRSASSPMMLVGIEACRFGVEAKVGELSRRLGAPVATTLMSNGTYTALGVPVLGPYLGEVGDPELTSRVESSDGLLMLGAVLSDSPIGPDARRFDDRHTILVANRQVHMGQDGYSNIPLDALVQAMIDQLPERTGAADRRRMVRPVWQADDRPLQARDIAAGINDYVAQNPDTVAMTSDIGDSLFTSLEVSAPRSVVPGAYGSMGFGIPAGIGAQLTTGLRPIILVGDGAFQMTGWELGHCARLGLDPIVVVFNNHSWQTVRFHRPDSRFSELGDWHYAGLADELGGFGIRVTTSRDFKAALRDADQARGSFVLIEAMLEPDAVSPTWRAFEHRQQAGRPLIWEGTRRRASGGAPRAVR